MAIQKWKKFDGRIVYKSRHFKVRKDFVELPSRQKTDFDVLEYSDMVGVVAVTKDRKILFVKQYRHPLRKICVEIPAGFTDGESPKKAAIRELEEETGCRARSIRKLTSVHPLIGRMSASAHIFFSDEIERTRPRRDETEFIEVIEIDAKKSLNYVINGKITSSVSVIGILAAHHKGLI